VIKTEQALSIWQRMRVWGAAHAVDDLYQGLVPASVPYFVLDRHYGYVAASGLSLAATLGAALPQPIVGLLVDRYAASWLAPTGVGLAGVGVGLSGLVPGYHGGLGNAVRVRSGCGDVPSGGGQGGSARSR